MPARSGDTVTVHYEGRLEDGTVFDTSRSREPLLFTLGTGDVIAGFDAAVTGLEPGDSTSVSIAAEDAYGPYHAEAVDEVPVDLFGEGVPEIGTVVSVVADDGSSIGARVTAVDDALENVTLDFNHPLAGHELTFDIELVEIFDTPPKEG